MRQRLQFDQWPAAIYAIGDVHGCLAQLLELERRIAADAQGIAGEKWLVTLGDLIDRGPDSQGVVAHVLAPPPAGFRRFALLGNHEQMMLDFLAGPVAHDYWLEQGGVETLASYGIDPGRLHPADGGADRWFRDLALRLPRAHMALMASMPVCLSLPGWLFVHAGVRPGLALEQQSDADLIWTRTPYDQRPPLGGTVVVHGHTPVNAPFVAPYRIGIDTGCFRSGRLSALRVTPDGGTALLTAG